MKLVILSLIGLLVGCGNTGETITHIDPKIIAFGNSITHSKTPRSYSYLVADELGLAITNTAVPGTAIVAPNQFELMMAYHLSNKDIVLYMPGICDLYYNDLDSAYLAKYESMLRQVLFKMSQTGATIFVATTLKTLHPALPDAKVEVYANILRSLIDTYHFPGVYLVETNKLFVPALDNMSDEVHPNDLGHKQIYKIFLDVIKAHIMDYNT